MIPTDILKQTEERYVGRSSERIQTEYKLRTGSKLLVDNPERVDARIRRLRRGGFNYYLAELATPPRGAFTVKDSPASSGFSGSESESSETPTTHVPPSLRPDLRLTTDFAFSHAIPAENIRFTVPRTPTENILIDMDALARERIIDKNNLMSINYLERGLRVSRSVARIRVRSVQGQTLGFGTGFMVSPQLLLTNNHVLPTDRDASFSFAEFNFQDDLTGRLLPTSVFALAPEVFFTTSEGLDFTLVAVKEKAREGSGDLSELRLFGWNKLIEEEGKAILGEYLNIIQHPNGEPKQLALRENQFVDLLDNFIHYKTDTAPGSSGSPVFNDQWEIVGLHHSGVPRKDVDGHILARDGSVWQPAMGEHKIHWIANEGVRISRLIEHLKRLALNDAQRRLRKDLLEKESPLASMRNEASDQNAFAGSSGPSRQQATTPVFSSQPRIKDGNAVWTLPLQVSIRLGAEPVEHSFATATTPSSDDRPATNGNAGPTPVVSPPSESPLTDPTTNSDLADALAEVRRARSKKYYEAAQDETDRDQYYVDLPDNLTPAEFFLRLHKLLEKTHKNQPKYKPATHVYPWVDLQPNLKLRSVYSGIEYDPEVIIQEDFRIDRERTARLQENMMSESFFGTERMADELDLLEAVLPYNCEHVVPQSWFEKQEPRRGDIHHLFACESGCNSFRGNTPYFDFRDFGGGSA
ncbi:MAG TPA: trypsin-like peptidase domain-containing protein [Pyrinomonadaceae bacterium]